MIIGLTGTLGAGKDAAAKFFMKNGFSYHSCSDIIRNECKKRKIPRDRDNLIKMGNGLREKYGPEILAKMIIERKIAGNEKDILVVSIRNPSEVEELRKQKDFVMIAIDAPIELRYKRITARQEPRDHVSFDKFKQQEENEMAGDENMQQLNKVMEMADHKIINDGTLEQLQYKLEDLLDYLRENNNA
ncbi:MAG: AAA family ATPase [Nanoarchaeota archaeon]|nr:AAA family ATPase [Nanoarchaeota archaeon]